MITIGTRGSALALAQTGLIAKRLGADAAIRVLRTAGDVSDRPIRELGDGVFVTAIEEALRAGEIDLAVHSLKDLPTESPDGLVVAAVLVREDPRDALVVNREIGVLSLDNLPRGSRVGTSSLRRRAQLLNLRPDLEVVELRGNVPTRLKKVDEGRVHAAILAAAGLHRLDAQQHIACYLDAPAWLPAAGQGAIAVQIRGDDERMLALADTMNHEPTMSAVRAERSFLAALEGGCQVPIGALAMGDVLHGFIADVQGTRVVRGQHAIDGDPELGGIRLANQLRGEGASEILEGLRRATHLPSPQPE